MSTLDPIFYDIPEDQVEEYPNKKTTKARVDDLKIAIMGWKGNPERAAQMVSQYIECEYIGTPKAFVTGYDIVLLFGFNTINILKLLTCKGKKIIRICGSDWYKPRYGSTIRELTKRLVKYLNIELMYSSQVLKDEIGLKGEYRAMPINDDLFYNMNLERDIEYCYYIPPTKIEIYAPSGFINDDNWIKSNILDHGGFIIDGSIPYEDMPLIYNRSKKYIRETTHDADPKMPFEALLCGCEVWYNGKQIKTIPYWMIRDYQIPKWIKYFQSLTQKAHEKTPHNEHAPHAPASPSTIYPIITASSEV